MQVSNVQSVGSTPSIAGLGREAMILNFCNMVDEWLDLCRQYAQGGPKASTHATATTGGAVAAAACMLTPSAGTYKSNGNLQANLAATLLLATA